jgi:hypothetical protein
MAKQQPKPDPTKADGQNPQTYGKSEEELSEAMKSLDLSPEQISEVCTGYDVNEFWMDETRNIHFSEAAAQEFCKDHFGELQYKHFTLAPTA